MTDRLMFDKVKGFVRYSYEPGQLKPVRGKCIEANAHMVLNGHSSVVEINPRRWPYQKNNMDDWLREAIKALNHSELNKLFRVVKDTTNFGSLDIIYSVNDGWGAKKGKDALHNKFSYLFGPEIAAQGFVGHIDVNIFTESYMRSYSQRKKLVQEGKLPEEAIQTKYAPRTYAGKLRAGQQLLPQDINHDTVPPNNYYFLVQTGKWYWKEQFSTLPLSSQRIATLGLQPMACNWYGQLPQCPEGEAD